MGDSMVVARRHQILRLFTDDCTYEDVPTGAVNTGKDALRKFAEFWFSVGPDFKVDLAKRFETDHWAAGEWTMSGTQKSDMPNLPATGKSFSIRGSTVMELEHGKIRRVGHARARLAARGRSN